MCSYCLGVMVETIHPKNQSINTHVFYFLLLQRCKFVQWVYKQHPPDVVTYSYDVGVSSTPNNKTNQEL